MKVCFEAQVCCPSYFCWVTNFGEVRKSVQCSVTERMISGVNNKKWQFLQGSYDAHFQLYVIIIGLYKQVCMINSLLSETNCFITFSHLCFDCVPFAKRCFEEQVGGASMFKVRAVCL